MANSSEFEKVIRSVPPDVYPSQEWETRYIVDLRTGAVVGREGFLGRYGHYIVSNSTSNQSARLRLPAVSFEDKDQRKLELVIECELVCPPGAEQKLVRALHQVGTHPVKTFEAMLHRWTNQLTSFDNSGFIDNFLEQEKQFEEKIRSNALEVTGLELKWVRFQLASPPPPIDITLKGVAIRFSGSTKERLFDLEATFLVDESRRIDAIARSIDKTRLADLTRSAFREFFINSVTIAEAYTDLENVKKSFRFHLGNVVRLYGRRVDAIHMEMEDNPPPRVSVSLSVPIVVRGFNRTANVTCHIRAYPTDIASYFDNEPVDLDEWFREKIASAIKTTYDQLSYEEINTNDQSLQNQLTADVSSGLAGIGYSLETMNIIVLFEGTSGLQSLEYGIDGKFITRDRKMIKLHGQVRANFKDSKKIADLINEIETLPAKLETVTNESVTEFVRGIDSELYYANFQTLRRDLEKVIRTELRANYGAEISRFALDSGEAPIIALGDEISGTWNDFHASVRSMSDGQVTLISGSFRVESVLWERRNIFEHQNLTIEAVKNRIERALQARLAVYSSVELLPKSSEDLEMFTEIVTGVAENAAKEKMGLKIAVTDVTSDGTNPTQIMIGQLIEEQRQMILDGDIKSANEIGQRVLQLSHAPVVQPNKFFKPQQSEDLEGVDAENPVEESNAD